MKFSSVHGPCNNCGTLSSPCWRRGPEYAKHLCNACGSRFLVKGTLEGYRPGLKNRGASRRGKAKRKKSPTQTAAVAENAKVRWKETDGPVLVDKGVQVDPLELEQMAPFVRLLPIASGNIATSPEERSPESQPSEIKLEQAGHERCGDSRDSCEESLRNSDMFAAEVCTMRKRARKPSKPTSPGW